MKLLHKAKARAFALALLSGCAASSYTAEMKGIAERFRVALLRVEKQRHVPVRGGKTGIRFQRPPETFARRLILTAREQIDAEIVVPEIEPPESSAAVPVGLDAPLATGPSKTVAITCRALVNTPLLLVPVTSTVPYPAPSVGELFIVTVYPSFAAGTFVVE